MSAPRAGIVPYDLAPPAKQLIPAFTPLRATDADLCRNARLMAEERRKSAEQFELLHGNWEHALGVVTDSRVKAVLELHAPSDLGDRITCTECASYDSEGDSSPDWPCDTYKAVTG